jgi:serine/threonine-protein kinase
VDGADLKQVINHVREQGRPFPIEQAVYICVKMCEGLAYAHETTNESGELLHVVHRDISPPNVLISKHGEIKIVDFGLAKASTQLEKSEAGIIKGKFSYLAPEAAHGQEVDARADIFAVGIILWEMLAGRRLFQGTSDYETVKQVQGASVPPISRVSPEADAHLERILARTLARDREKRYGSARSLGRDLSRYLYQLGKPVSAFDIAELVHGPITARERKKRETEGTSIIDKLIQETLFQFTSLQDKDASVTSEVSDAPFSFEDFAGYADDGSEGQRKSHIDIPDLGNLASLEDDEMRGSSSDLDVHAVRDSLADLEDGPASGDLRASLPGAADQRASMASMPQHSVAPPPKPSTAALKALLLIVIAAGTAAAVWFSGLL